MTASRALPAAVVERCARAIWAIPDGEVVPLGKLLATRRGLAGLLMILEQRAGPDWRVFVPGGIDAVDPDEGIVTIHEVTLAELLEEQG